MLRALILADGVRGRPPLELLLLCSTLFESRLLFFSEGLDEWDFRRPHLNPDPPDDVCLSLSGEAGVWTGTEASTIITSDACDLACKRAQNISNPLFPFLGVGVYFVHK